ncbi:MAG: 5'-nucleotidase domain-containing protein [Elusimicrobia bacterium]|nr:MAG: 5'-nucleotidase domain-containing protein [Elusimicrobiota bacterium]
MSPVLRVLLIGLCALAASPAAAKVVPLVVVHTNDVHGWILPRPDRKASRSLGGAAALAAYVKAERAAAERFLLLDGGDWWQGTPEGSIPKGKAVGEVFDALGYDAVVTGNHEFDSGEESLKSLVAGMKTPVVTSNVLIEETGAQVPYLKPFLVKDVGGVKVGIFGLVTSHMRRLQFPKNISGLAFEVEAEAARKAVTALKAQGAEVVVMLSHVGQEYPDRPGILGDETVVKAVPGIDLVVGGHVHLPLDPARRVGPTLIVNTGCYLEKAGKAVLEFDDQSRKVVGSTASLRTLWLDEVGEDAAVKALAEKWRLEVGHALDVVVATATAPMHRDRLKDSVMGNWVTDCMRRWTKTDLSVQNSGGLRFDFAPGPIRLRDIFTLMPFDNHLVTVYLTGKALGEVFESSVSSPIGVLQLSGGTVRYDASASAGSRLKGLSVRGRPVQPEETYSVTVDEFVVKGGAGFSGFGTATESAYHDSLTRDILGWCATEEGTLRVPALGRYVKQ